ncbi:MAG: hypothetical protein KJ548_08605 [Actinobacteria bacterium]|nr:hypothetical protein [Actinomycetota bacterium]MCG2797103.1 hypothetical protein [Cellulomonas sp.]
MNASRLPGVPSPALLTMRTELRRAAVYSAWFWVMATAVVAVATAQYAPLGFSFIGYGRQAVAWFLFSQAITLVAGSLRIHVAAGMTRRSFVRGSLGAHLVIGFAHGVVFVALLQLERLVHQAAGWSFEVHDGLDPTGTRIGVLLMDFGGSFVVASLSGLLVGIVYQRVSGWWGTLALPLTVGPLLVVLGSSGGDVGQILLGGVATGQIGVVAALVTGAALASAAAFALLSIRAPIRLPAV